MDINSLRTAVTLLSLLVFLVIVVWTYSSRNKAHFDELAGMALQDEADGRPQ
ncbi:CcoQ/FixQ family Cbb3-type cytochrome c oxidase assembly chaperone [Paucibacter aquatile]|jgi:cytochrome c oxidase cbb3-type subunit 4|uniref:CcoQ/FixQ family Cbb3-type cytochrome c oxidase assembly chaperone n=1 Tax=Kinneretia aquatilis TaxID=2070761 RepID=A0A2N8KV07_9BURK|nr:MULTISPECIES: cbb3-type cytochrome c oxidase subunit 3 [Roseateles]PND37260.1 CcoQ/FixQ family Cbb3-type cytochrome c oxidase assembly chaperone [Paucibacter aquatile]WIV96230.1 cbb3-type cytochrome c oxidase subunit 3 [Paucibacter aquatile]